MTSRAEMLTPRETPAPRSCMRVRPWVIRSLDNLGRLAAEASRGSDQIEAAISSRIGQTIQIGTAPTGAPDNKEPKT